uniref:Glyco_transf_64 domain-containing protein n=1 Tax=Haemonchus contortus TaxID=6289 RepID=A0A7I4Y8X0_HAECO
DSTENTSFAFFICSFSLYQQQIGRQKIFNTWRRQTMPVRWPAEHTRTWSHNKFKKRIALVLLVVSLLTTVICVHILLHNDQFSMKALQSSKRHIFDKGSAKFPKRHNMNECPPYYGKITVFVVHNEQLNTGLYDVAQRSLKCYLKTVNYTLLMVDINNDPVVNESCSLHKSVFYTKHCAVNQYLYETDWMLVLDADTGVVNPDHCIEEYIDDRVDVILIERFFNWEFSAGNYLIKNSPFGHHFLRAWTDFEFKQNDETWHGFDQGGLMLVLLQLLVPNVEPIYDICERLWKTATGYATFMSMVTCVREALGSRRLWPGKVRIYNKAHGFVRDGWSTGQNWAPKDFMFHGWKAVKGQKEHPFSKIPDPAECGSGLQGWHWINSKRRTIEELRSLLKESEQRYREIFPNQARVVPFVDIFNVSSCYPHCETV